MTNEYQTIEYVKERHLQRLLEWPNVTSVMVHSWCAGLSQRATKRVAH
jgi:hypothetical protein